MSEKRSPASSRTDWARLEAQRDQDIDLSDAPEVGPKFFRRARLVLPQPKERVTIRLDAEVVAFFKAKAAKEGGRYQSWINAVLKEYVSR